VEFVRHRGQALDVGAGALQETRWLLAEGFAVTAIDNDPQFVDEAQRILSPHFQAVVTAFDQFSWPLQAYDLVVAMFALPFNPPATFDEMFQKLLGSLKSGGVFAGQFFGPRDEWNTENSPMSFHNQPEIEKLLSGLEVLLFKEEEKDGPTATGPKKHWHIFHVIARKP
jgi:trans-aconitate methyltransferase